jgi:hypothetical protein
MASVSVMGEKQMIIPGNYEMRFSSPYCVTRPDLDRRGPKFGDEPKGQSTNVVHNASAQSASPVRDHPKQCRQTRIDTPRLAPRSCGWRRPLAPMS